MRRYSRPVEHLLLLLLALLWTTAVAAGWAAEGS